MEVLRTPDERFTDLPGFPYEPRHVEVDDGEGGRLRVAYVDEGPADGETVLLMHGEPSWSFLYRRVIPVLVDAGLRYDAVARELGITKSAIYHHVPGKEALLTAALLTAAVGQESGAAVTVALGDVPPEVQALMRDTDDALWRGLAAALVGGRLSDVSHAVESHLTGRGDYGILDDYTGHGIGTEFHNGLIIPHYDAAPHHDDVIEVGMVFTVEPMLNLGSGDAAAVWSDGWTVVSRDGSRSAQFENTVVITEDGYEILTSTEA